MAPPPTAGGKPKGKIKTWHLVAGAVGLVGVYYLYEKRKAASAATAATAATPAVTAGSGSSAGTAASSYGNAGDLASLLPYLNPSSSQASTGSTSSGVDYQSEQLAGGGYGNPGQSPIGTPVSSSSGTIYQQVSNNTQLQQLVAGGQSLFYQPVQGVFTPVPINSQSGYPEPALPANTPVYIASGYNAPATS